MIVYTWESYHRMLHPGTHDVWSKQKSERHSHSCAHIIWASCTPSTNLIYLLLYRSYITKRPFCITWTVNCSHIPWHLINSYTSHTLAAAKHSPLPPYSRVCDVCAGVAMRPAVAHPYFAISIWCTTHAVRTSHTYDMNQFSRWMQFILSTSQVRKPMLDTGYIKQTHTNTQNQKIVCMFTPFVLQI